MRILHLDSGRELRGGQWQVLQLLQGLQSAGCECTLLARQGSPLAEAGAREGLDVRPLTAATVALLSRRHDLTHAHDARTHTLAAVAARRPFVVSRRVAFPVGSGALSAWKYRCPARYLAISEAVRVTLERAGVPASRIRIVPDGVAIPDRPGYAPHGPIVALQSSDPLKGGDLIREAAALAGVPVSFSSDLAVAFESARLFLYISQSEGLGSAALLAMAAGVPVIASNVGGLAEVVENETTGLLVENTPAAIANAIRRMEADPERTARYSAAGRERVLARFTVASMVRATMAVYQEVLAC